MDGLTQDDYERIEVVFHAALAVADAERDALVHTQLQGQPQLITAVQRLLRARQRPFSLDKPVFSDAAGPTTINQLELATGNSLPPGTRIGAWHIEELLARGGMSRVYLACRDMDGVDQHAALKLIAADADLQRFAIERRVLAELEHPGIARLIDGGISDDGSPWLASEYVAGQNITEYCNSVRLDLRQRIRLLAEIADAIAYAHAHLIVHRDVKPANILINAEGHAKLVDFGIAKLLEADGDSNTRTGASVMTPQYAAPEQVLGKPITVQTDVHALGVLAYELVSGNNPFGEPCDPLIKVTRAIVDDEPVRPSSVCRSPAQARKLRGDLDAIVLKALRKNALQRYETAASFAADLRHFLAGEAVAARRGSRSYRIRSLIRRHRWAFAFTALMLATATTEISIRVKHLADERDQANAAAGFLRGLISDLDPSARNITDANQLTVAEVLDAGRIRLDHDTIEPTLRAQLLVQLAQSYGDLFEWAKSEATARDALAITTRHRLSSTLVFETKLVLAEALTGLQHHDEAEKVYLDMLQESSLDDHAKGLLHHSYGNMLSRQGRMGEAVEQLKLATQVLRTSSDPNSLMDAQRRLATTSQYLGRQDDALAAARQALQIAREHFPENQVSLALSESTYASILGKTQPQAAQPILKKALQRFRRVLGADHHNTRSTENNYAMLLWKLQRYDEAEQLLRSTIQGAEATRGKDSRAAGEGWQNLAALQYDRGRYAHSVRIARKAFAIFDTALPPGHLQRAFPWLTMAGSQLAMEQPAAALASLKEADATLSVALPPESLPRKVVRARRAMAMAAKGQCKRALPLLQAARHDLGNMDAQRYDREFDRALAHCPQTDSP